MQMQHEGMGGMDEEDYGQEMEEMDDEDEMM
jgi:hypothetical protein